jgi:type VI secretion system protein VasD
LTLGLPWVFSYNPAPSSEGNKVDLDIVFRRAMGLRTVVGLGLVAVLGGCAHHQKGFRCELPPPLFLIVAAGNDLNPSERGEALPTLVRVMQLSSVAKADTYDPKDLWDRASETLGPDLIAQEEFTVEPGERILRWVNRRGLTNYLMAVALFRQPTGTDWRTVVPLAPIEEDECPAEAPPPRTGNPKPGDLKLQVSLDRFLIQGGKVGVSK